MEKLSAIVLDHDHTRTEWGRMKVLASENVCVWGGYMRVTCLDHCVRRLVKCDAETHRMNEHTQ